MEIQVIDTGPGIDAAQQQRVFDEYVQVAGDAAPANQPSGAKGLGLGLAIVRRLAGLLGHTVRLQSVPGRGSTFSVRVPHAVVPPQHAMPWVSPQPDLSGALSVMLVDDDPQVLGALTELLQLWGHTVHGGRTVEAVRAATSTPVHCRCSSSWRITAWPMASPALRRSACCATSLAMTFPR
jgi:hypothetical protein